MARFVRLLPTQRSQERQAVVFAASRASQGPGASNPMHIEPGTGPVPGPQLVDVHRRRSFQPIDCGRWSSSPAQGPEPSRWPVGDSRLPCRPGHRLADGSYVDWDVFRELRCFFCHAVYPLIARDPAVCWNPLGVDLAVILYRQPRERSPDCYAQRRRLRDRALLRVAREAVLSV